MAGVRASAKLTGLEPGNILEQTSQQRLHLRRSPPRDAKIRLGHKKQKLSHSPEDAEAQVSPAAQLKSQGSSSDQSANRWFDNVNQHIPQSAQGNTEYDDEPPFFVSNQNNYFPNTFAPSEGSRLFGVQSRLDSENEELRGVIDDLTIENKRLKQILHVNQRSQRGSPSTEGQDKLFEVRMHGLSSDKRRELEFLLKNFATSVHTSAPSIPGSTAGSGVSSNSVTANNKSKTDSGYASNSNSGNPSMMQSLSARGIPSISQSARDKSIKNYLHDIPDTLMPRQQPMVMSERSKMALVVRRLEQLFTGKNAAPGEHFQPLQQQEVSQMAAKADAKNSKKRKAEGTREAHILPPDSKVNFDAMDPGFEKRKRLGAKASDCDASISEVLGSSISRPGSPDQRPTRPLDLDIHRAQVAAENIQYIRHLGLSSPRLDMSSESNESWIYLNLLTNMAQLHTINVTPEFVRRAVKKLSTKFELSKDGYKVRWIGGSQGTVFSKEEERAMEAADKDSNSLEESNDDTGTGGSSSKRSKTDSNSNPVVSNSTLSEDKTSGLQTSSISKQKVSTGATSNQFSSLPPKPSQPASAFDYKPIVYRGRQREATIAESYLESDSSPGDSSTRGSSGLVHALSRSNLNQQRNADEGLITFYNNPFFCSDYSGDKMPNNMLPPRPSVPGYLIGGHPCDDFDEHSSRLADACYFTPKFGPVPFREIKDENLPRFELAPLSSKRRDEIRPLEFNVSGLGGVTPDDNFAIDVDVHLVKASEEEKEELTKVVPHTGTKIQPNYTYETGYTHEIQLLPSRLPPPSYIFFTSSSSSGNQIDDEEDEEESDETRSSSDVDHPAPPSFLQRWEMEDSGEMDMDDNDDYDDSSMDMLAVARAADPAQIAEQERQYLINQPGGRVVAGSLAATVGASRTTTSINDIDSDRPEVVSEDENDEDDDIDDDNDDDEEEHSEMDVEN